MRIYRMHRRHGQREITSARWQPVAAGIPSEPRCCTLPGTCLWPAWRFLSISTKANCRATTFGQRRSCQRTPRSLQFGVRSVRHLAVQVPSVVIPEECNILLNPNHADYRSVLWSEPRPFRFDPRLFIAEPETL